MGRGRTVALGASAGLLALFLFLLGLPGSGAGAAEQGARSFTGVASCAGSTCHGRSEADGKVVRQDELATWQDLSSAAGAHSRAWRVLTEPRSRAIAARLGLGEATGAPQCLGCHATAAPPAARGPRFQLSDGVGCESCHGAASGWLSSHYAVGGTHAANVARGLVPLDRPRARAARCLDCHLGSGAPGQFVDHRMMAAGHPRLAFELDLFSTLQQHHDEDADYVRRKRRSDGVETWAVGQAMAVERSLALFASARGTEGAFPEFYFFDCHSCHRAISDDPRFEPSKPANPGRPIPRGMPAFNDENMIMLSAAAKVVAPDLGRRFDSDSRAFHAALATGRGAAVEAARPLRDSADAVASAFSRGIGRAEIFAMIETIAGGAVAPRFTDYAGSVQAVMAVDTLLSALIREGHVSAAAVGAIREDINQAYQAVQEPNAYRPQAFRASLGRAAAAIGRLQ